MWSTYIANIACVYGVGGGSGDVVALRGFRLCTYAFCVCVYVYKSCECRHAVCRRGRIAPTVTDNATGHTILCFFLFIFVHSLRLHHRLVTYDFPSIELTLISIFFFLCFLFKSKVILFNIIYTVNSSGAETGFSLTVFVYLR